MSINPSIYNHPIVNENTEICGGGYIQPNEYCPSFFANLLKSAEEVLVSVGTFRALIDFTMGNFEQAILLDIDEASCEFNRAHLDLIKEIASIPGLSLAQQRYQYLAVLHTQWLSDQELKETRGTDKLFAQLQKREPFATRNDCPTQVQTILKRFYKIMGIGVNSDWMPTIANKLYHFAHPPSFDGYYWENDAKWARLVLAIQEGRICVVQGSITGSEAMPSIGKALALKGKRISIIDISNVPDYFSHADLDKFFKNLSLCPLGDKVELLFTGSHSIIGEKLPCAGHEPEKDIYGYYHLTKDQFESLKEFSGAIRKSGF